MRDWKWPAGSSDRRGYFPWIQSRLAEHVIYKGEPVEVGLVYGLDEAIVDRGQDRFLKGEVVVKIANVVCGFLQSGARPLAMTGGHVSLARKYSPLLAWKAAQVSSPPGPPSRYPGRRDGLGWEKSPRWSRDVFRYLSPAAVQGQLTWTKRFVGKNGRVLTLERKLTAEGGRYEGKGTRELQMELNSSSSSSPLKGDYEERGGGGGAGEFYNQPTKSS